VSPEPFPRARRVLDVLETAPRLRFGPDALDRIEAAIGAYPDVDPLMAAQGAVFRSRSGYRKTDGPDVFFDALRYRHVDERKLDAEADARAAQVAAEQRRRGQGAPSSKGFDRCVGWHPHAFRQSALTSCGETLLEPDERRDGRCATCYERYVDVVLAAQERGWVEFYGPRARDGRFHVGSTPAQDAPAALARQRSDEPHLLAGALQGVLPTRPVQAESE
jgi:hypothetical protein